MRSLIVLLLAIVVLPAAAQTPRGVLVTDHPDPTRIEGSARVNVRTGTPVALYHVDYRSDAASALEQATDFLRDRGHELGIRSLEAELRPYAVRETRVGRHVRFQQVLEGVDVYKATVSVTLGGDGQVLFVSSGFEPGLSLEAGASKGAPQSLDQAAMEHVAFQGAPTHVESRPVVFARNGTVRMARQVQMVTAADAWDVLVDAGTGLVFRAEPTAHVTPAQAPMLTSARGAFPRADAPSTSVRRRVDGTGMVFDPDPMTTAGVAYGSSSGHSDNGDADSEELTAARTQVTLRDITDTGSSFLLSGPLAEIVDFDLPFLGLFEQSTPDFDFTRSEPAFEAATVYYHLEHSMRYINEELGIALAPLQYSGGVEADPHGLEGAVNAQYLFTGQLRFGEGGVDMAEDPEVVLHELGHAIHDWITDRGISQGAGLSEGSADYWAASYTRSKSTWSENDPNRDNFGRWGGRPFFNGRRTDYFGRYPFDLTGAIHTDGQIWASSMIDILDEIGRDKADLLFLEGLAMTGSNSNTEDAARAVLKADSVLFGAENAARMVESFVERGFLFRAAAAATGRSGPGPLNVTFFDLSTFGEGSANSWAWDFESDGMVDATSSLASHTYEQPGLYSVTLTASNGTRTETTVLTDYVSVNSGVYVWEGFGNPQGRSGRYIYESMLEAGVPAVYSRTAAIHPSFDGYDAVFLSFGPFDPQNLPTPLDDIPARAIRDYVLGGGKVYVEGAQVFGSNQASNAELLQAFGMNAAGNGNRRPVTSMTGQAGSLAEGLQFVSSRQTANGSIDQYGVGGSGRAVFVEDGYGVVAVQNETSAGGRAVAMSYTMADLQANGGSSRDALLTAVMDYFGIPFVLDTEGGEEFPNALTLDAPYPNPAQGHVAMTLSNPIPGPVLVQVHDMLGRRVWSGSQWLAGGRQNLEVDTEGLPSGSYFVTVKTGERLGRQRFVVVR
ncbi:MAG: T9SS type A sorting domain-containing protein [Rhodothermales bacterium]|nr:T9SS type A sorting domain-containing protein [Rhodothermales bacterium]MBO6778109.1 T9SS type A sorting domain-containing protein [Rhodothermales bacterium]